MLEITIPAREMYDEAAQAFINLPETTLQLEHSLLSLSKWEAKWKKPFLSEEPHERDEILDYIRCMTISNKAINPQVYDFIPLEQFEQIKDYIGDAQTATVIYDRRPQNTHRKETITSELIYYWMIYNGIPFECQKWHLNRLLMLIRICGIKGGTNQSMSQQMIMQQNALLNAQRKSSLHSRG